MNHKKMRDFRKYSVWIASVDFAADIYKLTNTFPKYERFGLCDQLQRAAVSISSNIAEGASRSSEKDFARFLEITIGSAFEVETQLLIAKKLDYINEIQYNDTIIKLGIIERSINSLITKLKTANGQRLMANC